MKGNKSVQGMLAIFRQAMGMVDLVNYNPLKGKIVQAFIMNFQMRDSIDQGLGVQKFNALGWKLEESAQQIRDIDTVLADLAQLDESSENFLHHLAEFIYVTNCYKRDHKCGNAKAKQTVAEGNRVLFQTIYNQYFSAVQFNFNNTTLTQGEGSKYYRAFASNLPEFIALTIISYDGNTSISVSQESQPQVVIQSNGQDIITIGNG